ncbi:DMSO/TMAO reductase YedYZ molybdopterin-dependent catalytic subunit [Microbacterium endophyticum]|uniref:DMSO/TMAO reductase YedYZ molybdopterin-dependent catalytic subunit n=1 Tax=Microbacterium endophyticum TaxID=1526412 RepID=A0A7W4V3A4_9MICO|nr:molybdopterin-dependent oxidoreductase [Microbacterium endophyticum]MBB2976026.1 DMSO/TMAO reductase YedYZ molybdopterin-dependent catalytic subunit [Microbacterium endophyticum]NIK35055.1 DMSO/TMAO reductase YedYZ molybdopterin-dependent catalytic subunit [Microbacterium endophyticum]
MTSPHKARFVWLATLSGVVAAAVFLAAAELVALAFSASASPLLAVGGFVIDVVPRPLKELAISTFGSFDKVALLLGLGLAVAVAAALAGILQYKRPPLGHVLLGIAAVLAGAAVLTRAGSQPLALLAPAAGLAAAIVVLEILTRRLRAWHDSQTHNPDDADTTKPSRRRFLVFAGISALGAVVVGVGARAISAATSSVDALRQGLSLPDPKSRVAVPDGAELDIDGLSSLYTSNADFYRVDTALTVPSVDPSTWRLVIEGLVGERVELSFDDLIGMGLDEYSITLTCVSNEVGGNLVGSAKWLGVPVRDVLAKAAPSADADMVLSRSADGYTASTPLDALTDGNRDAILAVAMNGEPLPAEHGFPVRMVVPGLYGYVSATKWLTDLTVTRFDKDEAYWTPRGYDAKAPIKMSSRIDTPRPDGAVAAGSIPIAGVAWAQHIGISRVEVSIDNGDWVAATLSNPVNSDTWVQWYVDWDAAPGTHYLAVRAIDADGQIQTEERAPIAPNGSSGWQRTLVTVK